MALEKTTHNYEILIRFNDSGKIGAHAQTLTIVRDGEEIFNAQPNQPEPLTLAELQEKVAAFTDADWFVPESSGIAE